MRAVVSRGGLVRSVAALLTEDSGASGGLAQYKALITAGGIGTRLLPFSKEIPKEMFPIISRNGDDSLQLTPVVQAIFEQLYTVGVRTFYFVVGRGKRAIEDHFSPDFRFLDFLAKKGKVVESLTEFYGKIRSSDLVFLNQIEPLGFGDAVLLGRPVVRGPFLVQAADTFILSEHNHYLDRLAAMHQKYDAVATILLQEVADPRRYGVVEGDFLEEGVLRIVSAVEKPQKPRSNYAIMPVYLFTEAIFDALAKIEPGVGGELQLTDAIQRLAKEGKTVIGVALQEDERRLDIGSVETMIEALKISLAHVGEESNVESEESGAAWAHSQAPVPESRLVGPALKPGRTLDSPPIPEKSTEMVDRP
jgi:UTP--glucose-1-phosphate uridylyltransferase